MAMTGDMFELSDSAKIAKYRNLKINMDQEIKDAGSDLQKAIEIALDWSVKSIEAVTGTFWYYDITGDGMIYPKAIYADGSLGDVKLNPGEGIAGQVIENGRPLIIQNCQNYPRWAGKVDAKTGFRTLSMICVPLLVQDHVFGCIQIINKLGESCFDQKDLWFAVEIARDISKLFEKQKLLPEELFSNGMMGLNIQFDKIFRNMDLETGIRRLEGFPDFQVLSAWDQRKLKGAVKTIWNVLEKYAK